MIDHRPETRGNYMALAEVQLEAIEVDANTKVPRKRRNGLWRRPHFIKHKCTITRELPVAFVFYAPSEES